MAIAEVAATNNMDRRLIIRIFSPCADWWEASLPALGRRWQGMVRP
jgi:hypothetical protein